MFLFDAKKRLIKGNLDSDFPTSLFISGEQPVDIPEGTTAFGYIECDDYHNSLMKPGDGVFCSLPGGKTVPPFKGFLCVRHDYIGMQYIGGPVEELGRLKYIDGCSDSLLLSPLLKGDPCLNFLYVPPGLDQTAHTHPSVRVGMIISGRGYCKTEDGNLPLEVGSVFVLPPEELHSFHTEDDSLRIVVYHPESDFGPTHEEHPMINYTFVEGESLKGENRYRTAEIKRTL